MFEACVMLGDGDRHSQNHPWEAIVASFRLNEDYLAPYQA